MDAQSLLRSGDIAGARSALAGELRRSPADVNLRQFFWQLLAVAGEWDKAEQQLRTLALAEPKAMMMGGVYNQVLGAMKTRAAVMAGTTRGTSLVGSEPWVEALLDALQASGQGGGDAADLSEAALADAPATAGTMDGEAFAWIADADLRFGPMLEAVIGEHYGFVPFAACKRLKVSEPVDLRDTVWLPVEIETKSGQTSMAFVPVLYPGTERTGDNELMLARRTDWVEQGGAEVGLGQRLITSDGPENGILALRDIRLG
ncbi:type VI secretion system accessory protein TagJ [Sphingomonas sp.]|uniref:type VI secretion system accessory protein TagJ n=1 Tax=Sphingomonas sp. TaxID=28214 RepID=UPI0035BBFD27